MTQPQARIVEVLMRDGLQTMVHEEGWHVPTTEEKLIMIDMIADAGVPEIEVTGFVHPKVIPMLADADEVVRRLPAREGVVYRALVPNLKGAQRAIDAGCTKLSALIVASEAYSMKNSRMSVADNVVQIGEIAQLAADAGVGIDVSMGISFLCPFEGPIDLDKVLGLVEQFQNFGVHEISIADSIGMSNPREVGARVGAITSRFPDLVLGVHLHECTGMAIANTLAAYDNGATVFEACIGGYGGGIAMPISVMGMGNVSTEDVVHLFREIGVETGVDLAKLRAIGEYTAELTGIPSRSRVTRYGTYEEFHDLAQQYR